MQLIMYQQQSSQWLQYISVVGNMRGESQVEIFGNCQRPVSLAKRIKVTQIVLHLFLMGKVPEARVSKNSSLPWLGPCNASHHDQQPR